MIYIYDTLLWRSPSGEVINWLASSYSPSPDRLIHDLEIRKDIRWHDGKPFTAQDVAFTFEYFQNNRSRLPPLVLFKPEHIREVKATGLHSVRITLDKPAVTFAQNLLATFPMAPKHIWSSIADPAAAQENAVLVGTGPYTMKDYQRGKGAYLFEANDEFFLGKPFVKRIEFRPVGDRATALFAGEIDATDFSAASGPSAVSTFKRDPRFEVLSGPLDGGVFIYFDPSKDSPVRDVRFRRACALAINRPALVKRLLGGQGEAGNPGFLPPGQPLRTEVEQYRFDRQAAERLLEEAGYRMGDNGIRRHPGGSRLRIKTMVIPELETTFEVVQRDLAAVGIEIFPDPVDPIEIFAGSRVGFEMAIRPLFNLSADPDFMRAVFSSRAEQRFFAPPGYANAELDDLADRQLVAIDPSERARLLARMQHIVAADLPLLPLYYQRSLFVYNKSIFDQWSYKQFGAGPTNKQTLVTGLSRGTKIRPIKEPA